MRKPLIIITGLLMAVGIAAWSIRPTEESVLSRAPLDNEYEELLAQFGIASRMSHYGVAGVSLGVIKNGKLDWAKGYGLVQAGKPEKIDTETLFSVGSVSKVGTAVMSLRLHDLGVVDVDTDVNQYLKTWKIPENEHTRKQVVTLRHIMSHTGGLTVHGFADFTPGEMLPTTEQILKGVGPAKNRPIYVDIPVGSRFRYSGGGTTVEQMMVEDITGKLFHEAADSLLFGPLGMERSTYQNPVPESVGNIAKAHNRNGRTVVLPRGYHSMPETAASGLWTTPTDFSKLMIMVMEAYQGNGVYLSVKTVKDMLTPVSPSDYGLGPRIRRKGDELLFSHGGANECYRAHFIGSVKNQNGIIIFTNGTDGDELIDELLPLFEEMLF